MQNLVRMASGDGPVALRASIFLLQMRFHWSLYTPPRPPEPLGKKEQALRDAEEGLDEDVEWSDLLLQ